jgi:putative transposase
MGTFGPVEIRVPRARLDTPDDKTTEWKSRVLPAYQRRTKAADALIAGAYLSGTNTRRVRRALATVFRGAVSNTVSRVWRLCSQQHSRHYMPFLTMSCDLNELCAFERK